MKIKYIVGCLLIILLSLYGCDSMEENYEQYLEEYNYSGKITNLRVYPGYERVVLAWDNPKDQKSKSILIIYGPDSTQATYDTLVDSVSIEGLSAGIGYEFIVYTQDEYKNLSVPVSITAFPISRDFVETLMPPSLVIDVQDNEQVLSFFGLSNVLMEFSGKIVYSITSPMGINESGELDLTDQVITTDPVTGEKVINTINNLSVPVTELGISFLPPGEYTFTYTVSVWPIMGNLTSIDEVSLTNEITTMVQPIIINLTRLGGTITASAENPPNEGIEKLIDNDINTKLLAFEPSVRVIFEQSIPTVVTKYSITSANDAPDRDPLRWTLEGSNDGVNWILLDQRDNIDFPLRFQTLTFEIENSTAYKYYKLDMTNNSGGLLQVAEWTLYGPKMY
jgi:hypothetical protein